MRQLDTLCVGGLLLLLLQVAAAAFSAEPVVEVTTDALQVIAAPETGRRIIVAENDELAVRDLITLAIVAKLPALARPRTAAAISGDGNFVALGDGTGSFTVWQVVDPPVQVAKFKHLSGITGLQLSHDGQQIAVASANGLVVRAVDRSRSWVLPVAPTQSFELSADGRQISAHGHVWDVAARRRLTTTQRASTSYSHRSADSPPPFIAAIADVSPDHRFELGDSVVTVKRQAISDRDYFVVRLFDAKPRRQRAVLLFEDVAFPDLAEKQPDPVQRKAGIDGDLLIISTWNSSTLLRWRLQLPQALAAGEQFAVAYPVEGQWQGIARWNSQVDPLAELKRLKNWPKPRGGDEFLAGQVDFSGCLLRTEDIAHLANVKGLKSLRLDGRQFSNASLAQLQSAPWVETLVLGETCRIDQNGLLALSALPKLTTLEFEQTSIPPAWFAALNTCQHLRVLRTRCPPQEAAFAEILKWERLDHMEELPAVDCCISDEQIDRLRRLKSLRALNLGRAKISDGQLVALAEMPQLEAFTLHVDFDARQADAPRELLHGLRRVLSATTPLSAVLPGATPAYPDASSVQPAMVGTNALAPIAQFTHLKRLRLSGTGVSNIGMQYVVRLPHLQHLDLTGCARVSDAGLESIATLKELRTLNLEQTSVSESGVAKIKKALPKCVVSW